MVESKIFKVFAGLAVVVLTVLVTGCGSSNQNISSAKVGYFYDSLVQDLPYKCGSLSGETNENGEFSYTEGVGCEFYLGEMTLYVSSSDLNDSVVTPFEVSTAQGSEKLTVDEAYALAAILQSASLNLNHHMNIIESRAELIKNVSLKNGDTSVSAAFGNALQNSYLVSVASAKAELLSSVSTNGQPLLSMENITALYPWNDENGLFTDLAEDGLKDIMGNEISKLFNKKSGEEEAEIENTLNGISSELDTVLADLQNIESQLDALDGDFQKLFDVINKEKYEVLSDSFGDFYNSIPILQNKVRSAFVTLFDVNSSGEVDYEADISSKVLKSKKETQCNVLFENMYKNTSIVLPTNDGSIEQFTFVDAVAHLTENNGNKFAQTLQQLYEATLLYLGGKLPTVGSASTDAVELFKDYNNGITYQYVFSIKALQVFYNLTYMYVMLSSSDTKLKHCNPVDTSGIIVALGDSINLNHSSSKNIANINAYFKQVVERLRETYTAALISDPIGGQSYPSDLTKADSWIVPKDVEERVNALGGNVNLFPSGDWSEQCYVYQYEGLTIKNGKKTSSAFVTTSGYDGVNMKNFWCKNGKSYFKSSNMNWCAAGMANVDINVTNSALLCADNNYTQTTELDTSNSINVPIMANTVQMNAYSDDEKLEYVDIPYSEGGYIDIVDSATVVFDENNVNYSGVFLLSSPKASNYPKLFQIITSLWDFEVSCLNADPMCTEPFSRTEGTSSICVGNMHLVLEIDAKKEATFNLLANIDYDGKYCEAHP